MQSTCGKIVTNLSFKETSLAKRDKLTTRQKRQIAKTRQRKTSKKNAASEIGQLGEQLQGLLISRFGEQADVLGLAENKVYRCFLRQNLGAPVPGDHVLFRLDPSDKGIIESVEERHSLLQRPSYHQGLKPVVANVDRVFILVAPLPDFSTVLLDRYLIAIENADLDIVIIANKWDLTDEVEKQSIDKHLQIYQELNYPVIKISTQTNIGKSDFLAKAGERTSILVGQSGVGKSSLINWIFPEQSILTKEISDNSRLGQHTTTASQLFLINKENPKSGFIIDSPGIREFGLWHMDNAQIAMGFREFRPFLGSCKYRDCQHTREPGCEILKAIKDKKIELSRWENYLKILENNVSEA